MTRQSRRWRALRQPPHGAGQGDGQEVRGGGPEEEEVAVGVSEVVPAEEIAAMAEQAEVAADLG